MPSVPTSPRTVARAAAVLLTATLLVGSAPSPAAAQAGTAQAGPAKARADSARYPYTAADVQFMAGMIGHHAQAVTMSRLAPTHGASPAVRRLADRIINAQQDEIATMQQWLRDRGQPVPQPFQAAATSHTGMSHDSMSHDSMSHDSMGHDTVGHDAMPGMSMSAAEHATMPGMLTAAQMAQLDRARGAEFDRLFLTFMIQHHRGAVRMVDTLFGTYGAGQDETVFKFASDVHVDQTTEIARMQQLLADVVLGPA